MGGGKDGLDMCKGAGGGGGGGARRVCVCSDHVPGGGGGGGGWGGGGGGGGGGIARSRILASLVHTPVGIGPAEQNAR